MISPALVTLHTLWWQPGRVMDESWWPALALDTWQQPYAHYPSLRPAIDQVIRMRLGHHGEMPGISAQVSPLLADAERRNALCLALGLWALQCPDYLVLKSYRQTLSTLLSPALIGQLQVLFPAEARAPVRLSPEDLPAVAQAVGVAWLCQSGEPALVLCRLLWARNEVAPPAQALETVLPRLQKWL